MDLLSRAQFGALSALDFAIDLHFTRFDHGMCGAARADKTQGLQQLIELNVIAANGKGNTHEKLQDCRRVQAEVNPPGSPARPLMSECSHCRLPRITMTSFSPTARLDLRNNALLDLSDQTLRNALATDALQPIATDSTLLIEGELSFSVRWVSSLALKDRARVNRVTERRPDFNPFLPPEPALTVAQLGDSHLVVLNKFPVIDHHLLIVTRAFEAQTAALTRADFRALASVLGAQAGLGFYNGGPVAGASQAHKHLQWVPDGSLRADDGFAAFSHTLRPELAGLAQFNTDLPWRHAFVSLAELDWHNPNVAGDALQAAFATACAAALLPANADPMPPYNLLVSRSWLLVVPRRCEKWQDVSINSLAYAGSLFVRDKSQIERLRAEGPLAVMTAVGFPR